MINLKPISGSLGGQKVWTSPVGFKPTGAGLTTFTLTHNQGRTPDDIQCYVKYTGQTEYRQHVDYYFTGENRGWFVNVGSGINQTSVNVYRVDDGSGQNAEVYFQLIFRSEEGIN